jgi:protein ImuB
LTRRVGSSLMVEQVDAGARRLGLHAGMTLGQARAMVPELLSLEHEPQHDRAVLAQLANWALRFSPIVEPVEPDTLLLDITGCQRLFGGEHNIAQQARGGLLRQGFHTRAAVADTVGAACALATASDEPIAIAPPGQTRARLAPLPPVALRIEADVVQRLDTLGVRTIGDLLRLPRASLPARFGSQLVRRLRQALGEVYEEVTAHACEQPPAARIAFETPLRDLQAAQAVTGRLLDELFAQLVGRTLALRRVDCVLIYEQASPTVLAVGLSRASRAWRHVRELVRRRLETADLSPGLIGLRLVARETSRWKPGQIDLFEPCDPSGEEELGCLLDRLANRLGPHAVVQAELVDDYQPEAAFRYVPVGEAERRNSERGSVLRSREPSFRAKREVRPSSASKPDSSVVPTLSGLPRNDSGACVRPRPTRVLRRPLPIRVIALVPDGPPTWFALPGREHVVARAWGPERIETAWWRGPDVRRDYFRVSSETGEQFWIYRSAKDGRWFLHGVFA